MSLLMHRKVTVGQIVNAVAHHYGVLPTEITGPSRRREFMRPRRMTMHLARIHTGLSTGAIGRELGDRDHTTVIAGSRKADILLKCSDEYRHDKEVIVNDLFPNTPVAVSSSAIVARDQLNALCNNLDVMFAGLESGNATLNPHLSDVVQAARFVSRAYGALMRTAFNGKGSNEARRSLRDTLGALDAALLRLDHPDNGQESKATTTKTEGETVCQK